MTRRGAQELSQRQVPALPLERVLALPLGRAPRRVLALPLGRVLALAPQRVVAVGRVLTLTLALMPSIVIALAAMAPERASAAPPARNLCVELRESGAADSAAGWQVSSADARAARERTPQRLCVQNGGSASLALDIARPVQVWQTAAGAVLPVPMPATQWLHAGQHLSLRPRWAGGRAPVSVELAAQASRFDPTVAAGSSQPPLRATTGVQTTLRVPLGKWVTIASTGAAADEAGMVSSAQAGASSVLQLRVELAP